MKVDVVEAAPVVPPAVSWWRDKIYSPRPWAEEHKRKKTIPGEQTDGYNHTKQVTASTLRDSDCISH